MKMVCDMSRRRKERCWVSGRRGCGVLSIGWILPKMDKVERDRAERDKAERKKIERQGGVKPK